MIRNTNCILSKLVGHPIVSLEQNVRDSVWFTAGLVEFRNWEPFSSLSWGGRDL